MKRFALLLVALVALSASAKVKVACIGNSITYGYKLPDREINAYPSQLQRMLGDEYEVGNFGHSGATLLNRGHNPYMKLPEFRAALDFKPDIAVIHLGVNDTDPRNWPNFGSQFVGDYLALIDSVRASNPNVRVIIARLTPIRAGHGRFETGTRDWRLKIQEAIERIAQISGAELIDFDAPLRDRQELIFDNVHPDVEGATIMANTVLQALTGNYGGLSLPEIWQSGMVVQRNRPLRIGGTANAGSEVTLTLDGRNYRTRANNRGQWQVLTAPLVTGPAYSMQVAADGDTLRLTDILAGEVWLASGQSNMEFKLRQAVGGAEAIAASADPQLRIFNMREIARTDQVAWSDSIRRLMNQLKHYRPSKWEAIGPDNAGDFSAVAYFFARQLRDSLQVPVGVISNAVGGSGTEAWVDINTLERDMAGVLRNPLTNDYLQKWVQGRVRENLGGTEGLHPYLPGYLFASGIRPLGSPELAGVIWYQGESNAHNIELHERLFPMLVGSWRSEFRNPQLPFYFVQLSSINRPSWPEFRNSQRLMAAGMDGVEMAVSSDWGDPADVHPRNKRPVGSRLARLALKNLYGYANLEASGPTLVSAVAAPGAMTLTFDNASGLTTSDGLAPAGFEIAEVDDYFFPAEAKIIDNKVILTNMNVENPRYVRYGWQPVSAGNLINGDSLPASTFRTEATNAADLDIEPGMEYGVSGAFSGLLPDGRLLIAGGCNFPTADPLAPGAQKVFYKGIYAADPETLQWQRIGSLPEPMGYGASAQTPEGPVWVMPSGRVVRFNGTDFEELPAMPAKVDNAAAAVIGSTLYVVGGNVDGKPSRNVWALDLNADGKWQKIKPMPGNPRVQPVAAAANGALYVWGGFAGSGKDATVETSGLRYDPATKKWTEAADPGLTFGGGVAATRADGLIIAAGGVNRDVFLAALQNQAPDYLMHPIEWYNFNKKVMLFDPAANSWQLLVETPDAARAGASIIATPEATFIYGGELKPRIRTASTIRL
ncbi:MAG: cyclically-permuted mutarotase family protein [Muribaculaceae bacterium]|nr:cyclically-permuted mutarotase family protein [Muribaculaceae bacterium]